MLFDYSQSSINGNHMPITPSKNGSNSWIISYSIKVDGDLKVFTEEFIGTIKDAMLHEKQLRKAAARSNN